MKSPQRTIDLGDCATRDQARERFTTFMRQFIADSERQFITDLLTKDHGGTVYDDADIDAIMVIAREQNAIAITRALEQFERSSDGIYGPASSNGVVN